ncbi:hypothetical protein SAMN05428938_8034 [Streptomyces sp. KS_5]|nr:hypothetical protein SAMN05428938_8034 [Streptomyces sp. KS_5]
MGSVRWDQRAVAQVKVRGTATDQQLFTAAVTEEGWLELESDVPDGLTAVAEGCAEYTVEVRFAGSGFRAVTGARQRLEVLAERLKLDLTVTAVDLVHGGPDFRPHWRVFRPATSSAAPVAIGRRERLRRAIAEARGTGRQVRADSEAEALALAARVLPGTVAPPADGQVRPTWRELGLDSRPAPARRTHQFAGLRYCFIVLVALGVAIKQNDHTSPAQGRFWGFLVVGLATVAIAGVTLKHNRPDWHPLKVVAALFMPCFLGFGAGLFTGEALGGSAPDAFSGGDALLIMLTGLLVLRGLALLFHHAPLRAALPWLLPALLPFAPGLLPALGLWQPTLYLNEMNVDVEDVQIPAWNQFWSALAVLGAMSLWLIAPALLGLARHLHFMIRERWLGYAGFALLSAWCLVIGVWQFTYLPAVNAGSEAVTAALDGEDAPTGYGVDPEWVCVLPVGPLEKIPVDGGTLDPDQPYLKLGDADGTAVLTASLAPLKVRVSSVRFIPLGMSPGSHTCDEFPAVPK